MTLNNISYVQRLYNFLPCDKKIFGQRKLHLLFSVDLKHRVNLSPQVGSSHHFKGLKSHKTLGVREKNLTSLILCLFLA